MQNDINIFCFSLNKEHIRNYIEHYYEIFCFQTPTIYLPPHIDLNTEKAKEHDLR